MERGPPSQVVDTLLTRSQDNCQHDRSPLFSLWDFIVSPMLGDISYPRDAWVIPSCSLSSPVYPQASVLAPNVFKASYCPALNSLL